MLFVPFTVCVLHKRVSFFDTESLGTKGPRQVRLEQAKKLYPSPTQELVPALAGESG